VVQIQKVWFSEGESPAIGDCTVRDCLIAHAGRRGETAAYTVAFGASTPAPKC
jgi:hypothetical protein